MTLETTFRQLQQKNITLLFDKHLQIYLKLTKVSKNKQIQFISVHNLFLECLQ